MGVNRTSWVLAAKKFTLCLGLYFELDVDNILLSQQTLDAVAKGLEAELDLCHAVSAVLLDLAVVEEDAVVVEGVAVWAEVGDELAVGGVRAQCFALSKTHSSNGVNDVVFVSLTSLIMNRAHPRWEAGKSEGGRDCCSKHKKQGHLHRPGFTRGQQEKGSTA